MKMEKRKFRIGQLTRMLSEEGLNIEPSAIRFWEKEFGIQPKRSETGQRYYDESDLSRFVKIKDLLYGRRFTIEGARQALDMSDQVVQQQAAPHQSPTGVRGPLLGELTRLRAQLEHLLKLL
ncbi:MAG: MerR family transcriptional regulator [Candidatus Dependentiae bacterium]|nr:MerR family transcriptional regulator [Candidatus Dependentiae bacterium]